MKDIQIQISAEAMGKAIEEAISLRPPKALFDRVEAALKELIESGAFDKDIKAAAKKEIRERVPDIVGDMLMDLIENDDEMYNLIKRKVLNALK